MDIRATEIVPILLDPDSGNGDLQRAEEALKNYQRIRKVVKESIKTDKIDFFKADLKTRKTKILSTFFFHKKIWT